MQLKLNQYALTWLLKPTGAGLKHDSLHVIVSLRTISFKKVCSFPSVDLLTFYKWVPFKLRMLEQVYFYPHSQSFRMAMLACWSDWGSWTIIALTFMVLRGQWETAPDIELLFLFLPNVLRSWGQWSVQGVLKGILHPKMRFHPFMTHHFVDSSPGTFSNPWTNTESMYSTVNKINK